METQSKKKINWKELLIFYFVAVGVSAPFRLNLINLNEILPLPEGLGVFYRVLRGIGPAAGFLIVFYLLKSKESRAITFWGVNKRYSLLAMLMITVGVTLAGVDNDFGLERNYYGLLTGLMLGLYALGEEFGWRGYLQQALSPLPMFWRVVTIAVLWYVWHLNFLVPEITWKAHLIQFVFLIAGSWGLMKISQTSGSILFTAGVHLCFNLIDVKTDSVNKIIILSFAITVWIILMRALVKEAPSGAHPENA